MEQLKKREKLSLRTEPLRMEALLGYRLLVTSLAKEVVVEGPLRQDEIQNRAYPLGDMAAWVKSWSTELEEDKVLVSGEVEGYVVHYSPNGPRKKAFEEESFFCPVSLPGAYPGCEASAHVRVVAIREQGQPLYDGDKTIFSLVIYLEVLSWVTDSRLLEPVVEVDNIPEEEIFKDKFTYEALVAAKTTPFTLTSEFATGEEVEFVRPLEVYLDGLKWEREKEGIRFMGTLYSRIWVRTASASLFPELAEPFNKFIEQKDLSPEARIWLKPRVEYIAHDLEGNKVKQKAYMDVFLLVSRMVEKELVVDIEGRKVQRETVSLTLPAAEAERESMVTRELESIPGQDVFAGQTVVKEMYVTLEEDRGLARGVLEKEIFSLPQDDAAEWPSQEIMEEDFEQEFSLPGAGPEMPFAACEFSLGGTSFAGGGDVITQNTRLLGTVRVRRQEEFSYVIPQRFAPGTSLIVYVVRPQDTIRRIASRYGVPEGKIIRVNNLAGDEDLKEGQKIIISLI